MLNRSNIQNKYVLLHSVVTVNSTVPENFWDDIKIRMQSRFRAGHFVEGLCEGVEMAGNQLKSNFPRENDDINELPDKISFG